jgi:hypothetical protein
MITLSREPNSKVEFITDWPAVESINTSVLPQTDPPLNVTTNWTGNAAVYSHVISGGVNDTTYTVNVEMSGSDAQQQQVYKEATL